MGSHRSGRLTCSSLEATPTNLAPPGYYMVFLVNSKGVPSVAQWVHVGPQGAPTRERHRPPPRELVPRERPASARPALRRLTAPRPTLPRLAPPRLVPRRPPPPLPRASSSGSPRAGRTPARTPLSARAHTLRPPARCASRRGCCWACSSRSSLRSASCPVHRPVPGRGDLRDRRPAHAPGPRDRRQLPRLVFGLAAVAGDRGARLEGRRPRRRARGGRAVRERRAGGHGGGDRQPASARARARTPRWPP